MRGGDKHLRAHDGGEAEGAGLRGHLRDKEEQWDVGLGAAVEGGTQRTWDTSPPKSGAYSCKGVMFRARKAWCGVGSVGGGGWSVGCGVWSVRCDAWCWELWHS